MRFVLIAGLALAAAALVAACGDGDDAAPSPTASGPVDLSPRVGGLDAVRRYLSSEGVGGRKGDVTDPVDCKEVPEGDADEEYCIIDDASTYAAGLVILYVARSDSREDVWEVHLEPGENAWQVTDVEEVPPP